MSIRLFQHMQHRSGSLPLSCPESPYLPFWNLTDMKLSESVALNAGTMRRISNEFQYHVVKLNHFLVEMEDTRLLPWPISDNDALAVSRLHSSGRYKLSDWHFCACAINVKSSMCSETTKHVWYRCHGLFVNSPVMTTVNSCLKFRSIH